MKNYYQILQVDQKATTVEIKSAYRKLSKEFHPDLNQKENNTSDNFREIQEAYEVLSVVSKRRLYDLKLIDHLLLNKFPVSNNIYNTEQVLSDIQSTNHKSISSPKANRSKMVFLSLAAFFIILLVFIKLSEDEVPIEKPIDSINRLPLSKEAFENNKIIDKLWQQYNGVWTGSITEINLKRAFSINISADFKGEVFKAKYPDLGVSGTWSITSKDNNSIQFKETIDTGFLTDFHSGIIELKKIDKDKLSYAYYFPTESTKIAEGTLTKNMH